MESGGGAEMTIATTLDDVTRQLLAPIVGLCPDLDVIQGLGGDPAIGYRPDQYVRLQERVSEAIPVASICELALLERGAAALC